MAQSAGFVFDADGGVAVFASLGEAATSIAGDGGRAASAVYDEAGQRYAVITDTDLAGAVRLEPVDAHDRAGLVAQLGDAVRPRSLAADPSDLVDSMLLRRPPAYGGAPIRLQQLDGDVRRRLCSAEPEQGWVCWLPSDRQFHRALVRALSRDGVTDTREWALADRSMAAARREWGQAGYAVVSEWGGHFRVKGSILAGSVPLRWSERDLILALQLDLLPLELSSAGGGTVTGARSVSFRFRTATQKGAGQLSAALTDCSGVAVQLLRRGILRRRDGWVVVGSDRLECTEPALQAWVTRMVDLGGDHAARLERWRIDAPTSDR